MDRLYKITPFPQGEKEFFSLHLLFLLLLYTVWSMVNYDAFAHTFSESRKNLEWPELNTIIDDIANSWYTSILDIWCGNGRLIERLEACSLEISSYLWVDNSSGMIQEARTLHPWYEFMVCDMLSLQTLLWRQYDAIVFLASFHHLETVDERKKVLLDVRSLLSPTGKIYMTNWNLLAQERYQKSHQWNGDFNIKIGEHTRYYHGFTLDELEGLFVETGYLIEENRVFEGGRNVMSIIR